MRRYSWLPIFVAIVSIALVSASCAVEKEWSVTAGAPARGDREIANSPSTVPNELAAVDLGDQTPTAEPPQFPVATEPSAESLEDPVDPDEPDSSEAPQADLEPTVEQVPAPEPTATPEPEPTVTPEPQLEPIALRPLEHSSGLLDLSIPVGWNFVEINGASRAELVVAADVNAYLGGAQVDGFRARVVTTSSFLELKDQLNRVAPAGCEVVDQREFPSGSTAEASTEYRCSEHHQVFVGGSYSEPKGVALIFESSVDLAPTPESDIARTNAIMDSIKFRERPPITAQELLDEIEVSVTGG